MASAGKIGVFGMCVYLSYLRVLVQLLLASSTQAQTCTPDSNSEGMIIPNTNLPTEEVRMYFQEAEQVIPSFIMLRASQIEPTGFTSSSPTRAVWCQSANSNAHNGTWFQPPGDIPPGYSVVPTEDIDSPINEPYQMVICPGQVGLVRDTGIAEHEGLLQCVISDEDNITHTLTVGVYSGGVYDNYAGPVVDPSMKFSLVSTRDTDPPQFTLTFNSSFGPPTAVECVVDGSSLNTSQYSVHREVKNAHFVRNGELDAIEPSSPDTLDVTEVTVTMRVRQAGVYVCTVNVTGRQDSMPQHVVALGTGYSTANITIAATPLSVSAGIVSSDNITVSWTSPSPAPDGYEVFYQTAVNSSAVSGGNTSNTELTLTGLSTDEEYTIFVVAFGDTNTIPSPRSNTVTVPAVSTINVTMATTPIGHILYEATPTDILCDVAIIGVVSNTTGSTITRQWLGSTPITAGPDYTITNDTLHINQLSVARDNNRKITCVAMLTLSSGAQYVQQESIILTVEALSNNLFTPDVIIPGVPTAGDNFNIICRLDGVVERLVGTPTVSLSFINPPGGLSGGSSRDGSAYIRPQIFNPGITSDVGTYTCVTTVILSLGVFVGATSGILQIQIPPPHLTLTITPSTTPLYKCTPVNLTCSATLDTTYVTSAVTVSSVWTGPSGERLTSSSHITVMDMLHSSPYTSVVVFDQVDDTDSGDYQCNITVSIANGNTAVLPAMNITIIQLTTPTALPSNPSSPSVIIVNSVAVTTINATVMFSVERTALSQARNESYIIRYRGVERDHTDKQSAIIISSSGTSNSSYNTTLTDLQDSTTYKYSIVIITNCFENISTTERNFTTPYQLKAPASPPVNCTNTTFLPRLVTLTWSTLPLLVPEKITRYTLNCTTIFLTSTTSTITITTGILPYTNYSCKLTSQNIIGTSPPANCTFETSQDAPGDSPQGINYTPGANSIVFTWKPPTQPNGVITQYTLTVITVQQIQTVVLDGSTLSYLICNLHPLQQVRASISAATQAGEGPVVNIIAMTAAQAFSGVKQLRSVNSQSNILNISWAPPSKPHGLITQYSIVVENNNTEVTSAHRTHSRTTLTTRLIAGAVFGIPYYITVAPLDSCNTSGDPVSIVAFSKELSPLVAVMFTTNRSADGTAMTVSWQPVTLEQARGFFVYRVTISPAASSKRQAAIMIDVPAHNQTSITVSDLDPSVEYTVSVGVVNKNNMELAGPTLPPVTIPSGSSSNGISIVIVVGSVLASCVLVGIAIIAVIIIAVILKSRQRPNKKAGVAVHDGMNMKECAAYGTDQPCPSCDLHKPTGEPEYEEVKT